ncbi:MAG: lipid II flippase MurJ, partial [Eubacteriales bacterium]|nr:lipid II flippase MurJ [Eubacteriales bacterium]
MSKSIIKSSVMLMALSLLSKLLGLAKEMVMAYFYGATRVTDAYVVAYSATNLIIEGLVACTVMSLVRSIADQREDQKSITETVNTVLLLLCGLALAFTLVILCAPDLFIKLFASGFDADTIALSRTILLAMLPLLVLRAFYAVMSGYLESKEDFVVRGIGETVVNICVLLGIVLSRGRLWILGFGWVVGQTVICSLAYLRARRNGLRVLAYKPKPVKDPAIRALAVMVLPLFLGSLFNELNPIIDRNFASSIGEGVVSALNYSTRITKLFHQLFVVSVTTVLFPRLSKLVVEGSIETYKQTAAKTQSCLQLIAIPITVGIAILAKPLVEILFLRGTFDAAAVEVTANSQCIYAWYIPF